MAHHLVYAGKRRLLSEDRQLTKWDTHVAWNHSKVEKLGRDPQTPQRLAALPDLVTPFVICMLQWVRLPLDYTLNCVEGWEVHERVTAEHVNQTSAVRLAVCRGTGVDSQAR